MSVAQIEQFSATALKDPALLTRMMQGAQGRESFIRNAVAQGKSQGYDFTFEEADAWISQQQKNLASGELTDSQLEAVAGGKGSVNHIQSTPAPSTPSHVTPGPSTLLDPSQLLGSLNAVKQQSQTSLTQALVSLGALIAKGP